MGTLREIATGRRFVLPPRALVGRSRQADLYLPGSWVSGEHASVWWDGRAWRVRDLDSRNGTLLDGQHVIGSDGRPLEHGQTLAFGQLEEAWLVDDAAPPVAMAIDRRAGAVVLSTDGVLSLPGDDDPQGVVYAQDDAWWLEHDETRSPVADYDTAVIADAVWTLRLPEPSRPTDESSHDPRPDELHLSIRYDPSRENIRVDLIHRGARIGLDVRSHHEVLLILAEQRLEDAGRPAADQGWLNPDVLASMAGLKKATLNVHVQRLRKQFVECGVVGTVIDRRATNDLRLVALRAIDVAPL